MGTPNPFMFGDQQPPVDNPFMAGGVNPYMAQAQPQFGYNQYAGMQGGNPYGFNGMGYQQGQPQQNMFGYNDPYGQYGGGMAQQFPGANPGAALFGGPAAPPVPPRAAPGAGAGLFGGAEANPFAGAGEKSETPLSGTPGPAPITAQSTGGTENPFAEVSGSAVASPPHRGSVSGPAPTEEANPFAGDVTTSNVTSPPAEVNPFSDSGTADITDNPFAVSEPPALTKQDSAVSVKSSASLGSQNNQNLVAEMVGGLEVSSADMIDKVELATTPTRPVKDESSDTESETESVASDDREQEVDDEVKEKVAEVNADIPNVKIEVEDTEPQESKESNDEKGTGFGEIFTAPKELAPDSETLQTATSFVDINDDDDDDGNKKGETVEEQESESDSEPEADGGASLLTGGTASGLFDDPASSLPVGGTAAGIFGGDQKPGLSTGAAIFTDAPAVPDIQSTGAAIFGIDGESAAGTTGANIFDISAPGAARPCHGEMSGWDEAFDKKFNTATTAVMNPTVAQDAFGSGGASATPFGYPTNTTQEDVAFCDSFGMASLEADLNNPFKLPSGGKKSGDGESPDSILFEQDTSKPLDPWPRLTYEGDGWEMFIRHPPKKKITAQRYWKKVWVRIVMQGDNPAVLLFNHKDDKDPIQELPLQAAYSLSDISHQVFDQFTKVFTIKLQYIFYKERAGIRPGQVTKMQKLTDKIGFLAKAVEDADLKGVKEFASDMKKLGVPLEHAPQISELLKLASFNYEDMKMFSSIIEEKLFRIEVVRDRALTYKTEECQLTAVEEVFVSQDKDGHISQKICRVRVFFLSFLTGMPFVELGVNDMTRMGLEVVGRHDILPVPTEQWIRYEDVEFHHVVDKKAFEAEDHIIKFKPPDACYIEVMRFRCRPPRARELPIQARCSFSIINQKVEIKADVMVPYHATKAWGQVPCEDVTVRIPIPEAWVYFFRSEKLDVSLGKVKLHRI